jgi:hypothetical protein
MKRIDVVVKERDLVGCYTELHPFMSACMDKLIVENSVPR